MRPCQKQEVAASEVIGTVLLISIVVIAGSIIAVAVLSQPQAQKIPAVSALISNQSQIVYIKHNGGDPLQNGTYRILVDGADVTSSMNLPSTWSIGNTLTYTKPGTNPPSSVQIVYTDSGSAGVVLTSAYFGTYTGGVSPTATGTATGTVTPATTTTTITTAPSPSTTFTPTTTPTPVPTPVANFTANPTTVTVGTAVQFTDTSTNTPTSWLWGFGDGGMSTSQNPQHTYSTTGTYSVALTATNAAGSNTTTKSGYITATVPPTGIYIISATYGDLTGNTGTIVNVTSDLQTLVNAGVTSFLFNNSPNPGGIFSSNGTLLQTIPDPDFGVLKSVTVAYSVNGKIQPQITVTEGTVFTL